LVAIPVTTAAVRISGTASDPYLLVCDSNSSNSVYIGQDSAVSPNNYSILLTPGSSLTWTNTQSDVWAVTSLGSASVTVTYHATATFTPAATGTTPTVIGSYTFNYGTSTNSLVQTISDIPIANYKAIKVMVSTSIQQVTAHKTNMLRSWTYFGGVQYDPNYTGANTSLYARTNNACWSFADSAGQTVGLANAVQTYTFNVSNGMLAFNFGLVKDQLNTATTGIGSITVRIYGLYTAVTAEIYQNWIPGAWDTNITNVAGGAGGAANNFIPTTVPATISSSGVNRISVATSVTGSASATFDIVTNQNPIISFKLYNFIANVPFLQTVTYNFTGQSTVNWGASSVSFALTFLSFPYANQITGTPTTVTTLASGSMNNGSVVFSGAPTYTPASINYPTAIMANLQSIWGQFGTNNSGQNMSLTQNNLAMS
jgi:hypothetical protein